MELSFSSSSTRLYFVNSFPIDHFQTGDELIAIKFTLTTVFDVTERNWRTTECLVIARSVARFTGSFYASTIRIACLGFNTTLGISCGTVVIVQCENRETYLSHQILKAEKRPTAIHTTVGLTTRQKRCFFSNVLLVEYAPIGFLHAIAFDNLFHGEVRQGFTLHEPLTFDILHRGKGPACSNRSCSWERCSFTSLRHEYSLP